MNTIWKAAAAAALGLVLSGAAHAQSALNEVLDSGVLKVGTTGDWNPMSLRDPATNSYKGYDIDIMNELATDLGVEVEYVPTDWKTLVNGVVAGKYHLTGSASISPPRMKVAGFSDSYIAVELFPYTTKDKADKFDGLRLDQPARRDGCHHPWAPPLKSACVNGSRMPKSRLSKRRPVAFRRLSPDVRMCSSRQTSKARPLKTNSRWSV